MSRTRIADLPITIIDGDRSNKYPKRSEFKSKGVPFLNSTNIVEGRLDSSTYNFISEEKYNQITKGRVQPHDLVMTTRGSIGKVAYVGKNFDKALINAQMLILRADGTRINPRYLFYVFTSQRVQNVISNFASGSAQPQIPIRDLKQISLDIPDFVIQKRVSEILSAYDDLIENNSKRIEKLEAMTRLLYRHYFEAPEADDWEEKPIKELLSNHIGGGWGSDLQDTNFSEPAFVIRGTDIPPGRSGDISGVPFRYHKSSNLRSRALMAGDIIFEVSGGSKGQPLGRSMLITKELLNRFNHPVMCASFCKRISTNTEVLIPEVLYLSFLDAYENGEIETYSVQSTGISNFKWTEYIERVSRKIPPHDLQLEFQNKVAPVFSQIAILGKKNAILRETRDLLLPRLMSGEIEV